MAGIEAKRVRSSGESRGSGYITPERRESETQNERLLDELLKLARPSDIWHMPDLSSRLDMTGGITTGIDSELDSLGKTVLFSAEMLDVLSKKRFPDRISFHEQPLMRMGREDSFREVFFGQINQQWFHEATVQQLEIAVKPVPRDKIERQKLFHEVAMCQHAASVGLPTFEILAFIKNQNAISADEPYGFIVTKYEPDVTTIDGLSWQDMTEEEAREKLEAAVETLALLHSNYLFHDDLAFRNVATTSGGLYPKIIDLERGGCLVGEKGNIMKISRFMSKDFSALAQSIDTELRDFFTNDRGLEVPTERYDFMFRNVFEPYYERMLQLGAGNEPTLLKAYENVVCRRHDEARGVQAYWRHVD